jgi:hypothetical protein
VPYFGWVQFQQFGLIVFVENELRLLFPLPAARLARVNRNTFS